jgi:hypothetical protein
MVNPESISSAKIPAGLKPYFQEYDLERLNIKQDANLIIQRSLEFGNWLEIRWLFSEYGADRIRLFVRQHGERLLRPVVFNYWRKLLHIRKWEKTPFSIPKGQVWPY